jgi:hypothetical protein
MRDVTTAPLHAASLDWPQQHQPPAPFTSATVENNVPTPIRIYLLEIAIQMSLRPTPRHDEEQVRHDSPPLACVQFPPTHTKPFVAMVSTRRDRTGGTRGHRTVASSHEYRLPFASICGRQGPGLEGNCLISPLQTPVAGGFLWRGKQQFLWGCRFEHRACLEVLMLHA